MKRMILAGLSMLTLLTVATPAALAEVREVASPRIENPFDLQRLNPQVSLNQRPCPTTRSIRNAKILAINFRLQ
ncbi:MAG: hypothetical protein KME35_14960 [Aphanocapsa sp. GSE-SYN-MK-11-07L]|jgi:hypothetical protein|nr:hypothetical protein [Aphanocapsa sp. GSE-SYN-MK-11-07L]